MHKQSQKWSGMQYPVELRAYRVDEPPNQNTKMRKKMKKKNEEKWKKLWENEENIIGKMFLSCPPVSERLAIILAFG